MNVLKQIWQFLLGLISGSKLQLPAANGREKKPFIRFKRKDRGILDLPPLKSPKRLKPPNIPLALKSMADNLIEAGWKNEDSFKTPRFELEPKVIYYLELEKIIKEMLNHARSVAPGFHVPHFVPMVNNFPSDGSKAGTFSVDEEGYVSININPFYNESKKVVCSIVSHEICHYILENTGIRKSDKLENEQMTDVCMFVLGFGKVYRAGFKYTKSGLNYRTGHQLGYLSADAYKEVSEYVLFLRQEKGALFNPSGYGPNLLSNREELLKRVRQIFFGDEERIDHAIQYVKRRYDISDEISALKKLIEIYGERK